MTRLVAICLLLTGCACLSGSREQAIYGKCSDYDYNHDGVVGAPDYSLMMKSKPPPTPATVAGWEHYFGRSC